MVKKIVTASFLVLSLACSGESGDPAEQLHRFCERWNDARCAMADECGGTWRAACAATCDDPEWQRTFARLEQRRVRYDAGAAQECLSGMKPVTCGEPAVCRDVVVGVVEPGGECGTFEDCAGEATCLIDASCPGTCLAFPGPGDACDGSLPCSSGSFCHRFEGRCLAHVEEGDACDGQVRYGTGILAGEPPPPDPEAPTKICAEPLACIDGRCVQPSPLLAVGEGETCWGEACAGEDCWTTRIAECGAGLFCDFGTRSCEWRGERGEPCRGGSLSACAAGLGCHEGTCVPIVAEGAACGEALCEPNLQCIDGVCTRLPAVGEACIPGVSACLPSLYSPVGYFPIGSFCDPVTSTCVAAALDGESCDGWGSCAGVCEAGVCVSAICPL